MIGNGSNAKMSTLNAPISYSRARSVLKIRLESLGYDSKLYGLHSFRIGGATEAGNRGVPHEDLKDHGRWKTDAAKNLYVRSCLMKKLNVSKKLKLQ